MHWTRHNSDHSLRTPRVGIYKLGLYIVVREQKSSIYIGVRDHYVTSAHSYDQRYNDLEDTHSLPRRDRYVIFSLCMSY